MNLSTTLSKSSFIYMKSVGALISSFNVPQLLQPLLKPRPFEYASSWHRGVWSCFVYSGLENVVG